MGETLSLSLRLPYFAVCWRFFSFLFNKCPSAFDVHYILLLFEVKNTVWQSPRRVHRYYVLKWKKARLLSSHVSYTVSILRSLFLYGAFSGKIFSCSPCAHPRSGWQRIEYTSYALDSRFEPRSVYKYGCFSPKLKGLMGNEVSEWGRDRKALSSDITHPSIA